ncbi:DinB family protein [Flavihumibacter stibioxidans]|uniref:DinB-like domain-containing protein n=1 Tax=Flavihumibacter stibioxidans TaxID=1834163 RepID=A0ABR7M4A8_9BACT|nr:DinB family protein [Flavihumibacter stibioxidans]MBC6489852.1 hypothetical protein [Flavihumibacter stibioxidans]
MKHDYNLVYSDFYTNYIQLAQQGELKKVLKKNSRKFLDLLDDIPKSKIDYSYGKDKWTIKQLLQHITDAERVFAYRALRVARYDQTPLPGFDENTWAEHADVSKRDWNDMVKEFRLLRRSNQLMIESFSSEQLAATGTASNHPISVAALCFILAGHVEHHMNIIRERYLIK